MKKRSQYANKDYTKAMLPQTRRAVFFDVMHLQWKSLLLLGVILLLFFLPLLLSILVKDIYITNVYQMLENADETQRLTSSQILLCLNILRSLVNTLFLVILGVALSGVLRVIRQYAWGENVHLPMDFPKGIKDNFSQTAAICGLAGLIYTLCLAVFYTAGSYATPFLSMLSMLPIPLSALIVLPVFAIALVMVPVYNNRLGGTLKNSFLVYIRALLKCLLGLAGCMLIWVPAMLPNFYCHILGSVFAVLLTPMALLAWTLICYDLFDIHINPQVAPELIGKGTYPPVQEMAD